MSTAIVSSVGDASTFRRARDLAAWVGLVTQQHTTGGKPRLLGITKRGNSYLRRLFVQGARALWVWKDKHPDDPIQRWLLQLAERRHAHIAVCALANCSGLMNPDTDLGENVRHEEVSDEQATTYVFPGVQTASRLSGA
ncbi:transposase, partial [Burkholderia cepacia]|uniref:transposase n=1 Tax=Burkholderia cepacia TaxID=292 RepID=UPI001589043D